MKLITRVSQLSSSFLLTGLKDQVEAARSMVHGVVSKGPSAVAEYGMSQTIQVRYLAKYLPFIAY